MMKAVALRRSLLRPNLLRLASAASSPLAPSNAASHASPLAPLAFQVQEFSAGPAPKKEALVKVPTPVYGVAGKYAASLYVTAVRANALEPIYQELQQVMQAAEASLVFRDFLKDMSVPNKQKVKAIREIFEKLGFSEITTNFLALLAENGRLHGLQYVFECITELVMAHRGEVKALVTTAVGLKPTELEELKIALKRFVKPEDTILLNQKIDKRIMGGLVVDIGEKHIDLSIATKLKQMENILREPLP